MNLRCIFLQRWLCVIVAIGCIGVSGISARAETQPVNEISEDGKFTVEPAKADHADKLRPKEKASSLSLILSDAKWVYPDADVVAFLTRRPAECLADAPDAMKQYLVEVGRVAFNSPLLFGGSAARNGLRCASCHLNGHDNPSFFYPGLSDAAGSADVTTSLFSKVREDNVANAVPIPTLVDINIKSTLAGETSHQSLRRFIEGAVVEEFQGVSSPAIVESVAVYVEHLTATACSKREERQSAAVEMDNFVRGLTVVETALDRKDFQVADFVVVSLQQSLAPVHERYATPVLGDERKALEVLSQSLREFRQSIENAPNEAAILLPTLQREAKYVRKVLKRSHKNSLYSAKQLRTILLEESIINPTRPDELGTAIEE